MPNYSSQQQPQWVNFLKAILVKLLFFKVNCELCHDLKWSHEKSLFCVCVFRGCGRTVDRALEKVHICILAEELKIEFLGSIK